MLGRPIPFSSNAFTKVASLKRGGGWVKCCSGNNSQSYGREIEKCFAMLERSHDVTTDVLVEFPCIILFLDEDGLIVFANQFAESVLNIEEPKVLGMAVDQVNPQLGQQIGRLSGLGEKNGNGQFETKINDNSQSRYIYWRVTEIVPYRKQKLTVIIGFAHEIYSPNRCKKGSLHR